MNIHEFVKVVQKNTDGKITQDQVKRVIKGFEKAVLEVIQEEDVVHLHEFGEFSLKTRSPRTMRNPLSGESVPVPETKLGVFKFSKCVKEKLNGGK